MFCFRSNGRRNEDVKSNSPNNNNNNNSNAANINNNNNNIDSERRSRALKKLHRNADWTWLNACMGVYRGDAVPVIQYLSTGGDPTRQLTHNEIALLNRASAFDVGHTLVHIAIRLVSILEVEVIKFFSPPKISILNYRRKIVSKFIFRISFNFNI